LHTVEAVSKRGVAVSIEVEGESWTRFYPWSSVLHIQLGETKTRPGGRQALTASPTRDGKGQRNLGYLASLALPRRYAAAL
jgi:hypothetical protein